MKGTRRTDAAVLFRVLSRFDGTCDGFRAWFFVGLVWVVGCLGEDLGCKAGAGTGAAFR